MKRNQAFFTRWKRMKKAMRSPEGAGLEVLQRLEDFVRRRPGGDKRWVWERASAYLITRKREMRASFPKEESWVPRKDRWTAEERCRRQARQRGWSGMIRGAAYIGGVKSTDGLARKFPDWGKEREQHASLAVHSYKWHKEHGPVWWWQQCAAAVELSDTRMRVVGEDGDGRRIEMVFTRQGRGHEWRSEEGDVSARPLTSAETHWLVEGRGIMVLAVRYLTWEVVGTDVEAVRRVLAGDAEALLSISNVEMRRFLADILPADRLAAAGQQVARDDYGTLIDIGGVRVCRVVCPSTGRVYLLRVPHYCHTAHEAVAWTFGMEVEEYQPSAEA